MRNRSVTLGSCFNQTIRGLLRCPPDVFTFGVTRLSSLVSYGTPWPPQEPLLPSQNQHRSMEGVMADEPQEGAMSRFVVTTPAGLEAEARRELRQVLPGARFQQVFLKGNLLLACDLPQAEALRKLAEADTTVVASVTPVQRRVSVADADPSEVVAQAAAEIGRVGRGETFLVRCRRRGTHPWQARDLERRVADRLAEITGGVGEYQVETDWQVTIQVFQDTAYVGVNRPGDMLEKELHR